MAARERRTDESGCVAEEERSDCGGTSDIGVQWLLFLLLPPICYVLLSTSSFSLFLFVLFVCLCCVYGQLAFGLQVVY
jgi:hypothetical protein